MHISNTQKTRLIEAIITGNLDSLKQVVNDFAALSSVSGEKHWTNVCLDQQGSLAIHYAAKRQFPDIIEWLLDQNPDSINSKNIEDQTPLCLAIEGNNSIFIREFLKKSTHEGKNALCSRIRSIRDVEFFSPIEPTFTTFMLHDERIMALIEAYSHTKEGSYNVTEKHIYFYRPLTRSPSFLGQINKETKTVSIFEPVKTIELLFDNTVIEKSKLYVQIEDLNLKYVFINTIDKRVLGSIPLAELNCTLTALNDIAELSEYLPQILPKVEALGYCPYLGKGASGMVRLFKNKEGERVAVKSLLTNIKNITQPELMEQNKVLYRAVDFQKKAYPDSTFHGGFQFIDDEFYINRHVMPYIEGINALSFMKQIESPGKLAETVLHLAQELQRIHELGIIHGDIKFDNVLMCLQDNKIKIRFIDFNLSASIKENRKNDWDHDAKKYPYLAPERFNAAIYNINQDIYSFGYLLDHMLKGHVNRDKCLRLCPSIKSFINQSQNKNPDKRPSLTAFCLLLTSEIANISDVSTRKRKRKQSDMGIFAKNISGNSLALNNNEDPSSKIGRICKVVP